MRGGRRHLLTTTSTQKRAQGKWEVRETTLTTTTLTTKTMRDFLPTGRCRVGGGGCVFRRRCKMMRPLTYERRWYKKNCRRRARAEKEEKHFNSIQSDPTRLYFFTKSGRISEFGMHEQTDLVELWRVLLAVFSLIQPRNDALYYSEIFRYYSNSREWTLES